MKAIHYSHQGKRDNQEDALGFIEHKCYFVCDGVGGHEKGEHASNFVVDFVKTEFANLTEINKSNLQELIVNAQLAINTELENHPEAVGMGTTFAGVFISDSAFYIVHLGDSRIYWVKPKSKQIWHTWDHSMVGNLMQMGEISREEGRFHPNGNRISKAIIANTEHKTTKPDITKASRLDADDLFFICSDGVTEVWSEYELLDVLCDSSLSLKQKLDRIQQKCANESKDNNTAILLEVDAAIAFSGIENEEITWLTLEYFRKDFESYHNVNEVEIEIASEASHNEPVVLELVEEPNHQLPPLPENTSDSKKKIFMAIVLIIVALFVAFFVKKLSDGAQAEGDDLLILAKENSLYGFQNSSKEWVIPARFVSAEPFEDGRAKVTTNDSIYYINQQGEMIVFVGLVNEINEIETTEGTTPQSISQISSSATAPNSTLPNQTSQSVSNDTGSGASSGSNLYETEEAVERAYQKLLLNHANKKIPAAEEKRFIDRIADANLKEIYKKKIAKHNSAIPGQNIPTLPNNQPAPNPTPTPTPAPPSVPDVDDQKF
jgi:protein phosphatase